ncbi:MAG TPA: hypothetical protein VID75_15000 [Acidimicrobiales bacterium]|jgi:predicted lipoprotein with Yx(FWY)xxD motif
MVSMTGRQRHSRMGRASMAMATGLTVTALVAGPLFSSAASARAHKTAKPTMVVKAVNNSTFGMILETKKDLPLYTFDMGTCSAATNCSLTVWPPLLMPKGKTVPGGVPSGLGTQPFGSGRLQVTYKGSPLYTFASDKKNMVNGNGVGGFSVAKVS